MATTPPESLDPAREEIGFRERLKQRITAHKPLAFLGELQWTVLGVTLLVSIALLLVSVAIPYKNLFHHVTRDIGLAGLIAVLLATLIEYHQHRRHDRNVQREAIDGIIEEMIGAPVWREIRDKIARSGISCTSWVLSLAYRLEPGARTETGGGPSLSCPPCLLVEGRLEYRLQNHTGNTQIVKLRHELEDSLSGSANDGRPIPAYMEFFCRVADRGGEVTTYGPFDHAALVNSKNCTPDGRINFEVEIPPGAEATVTLRREEFVQTPGQFPWFVFWITENPRVEVTEAPEDLEFEMRLRHPSANVAASSTPRTWTLNGIFLPGQGFSLRTRRKVIPPVQPQP
jgi:hypothetical protein